MKFQVANVLFLICVAAAVPAEDTEPESAETGPRGFRKFGAIVDNSVKGGIGAIGNLAEGGIKGISNGFAALGLATPPAPASPQLSYGIPAPLDNPVPDLGHAAYPFAPVPYPVGPLNPYGPVYP